MRILLLPTHKYQPLLSRVYVFSLLLYILACPALADNQVVAWSEYENQEIQLFLAKVPQKNKPSLFKVTKSGTHITPSLVANKHTIWLIWVDRSDHKKYELKYAEFNNNNLSLKQQGNIVTQDTKIYSPSITLSSDNTPWASWSGLDDQDEEIKVTSFTSNKWNLEQSLTNNSIPDTRPIIGLNSDKQITVWWLQNNHGARTIVSSTIHAKSFTTPTIANPLVMKSRSTNVPFDNKFTSISDKSMRSLLLKRKKTILMGTSFSFN